MRKQLIIISSALTLILTSCGGTQSVSRKDVSEATTNTIANNNKPSSDPFFYSTIWQYTSAEYEALCIQAYNIAKNRVSKDYINKLPNDKPLAIIFDIDETVLNNTIYNLKLSLHKQSYNKESWDSWVNRSEATLIPGFIEFYEHLLKFDISIFFISNRNDYHLEPTLNNFRKLGLDIDEEQLLLNSENDNKISRREKIFKDFNVIMLLGDNLADFNNELDNQKLDISERKLLVSTFRDEFGKKFIIFPNPMYGAWLDSFKNSFPLIDDKEIQDTGIQKLKDINK